MRPWLPFLALGACVADPGGLVGSWRELPHDDGKPVEHREVMRFDLEGTYTNGEQRGSYSVEHGVLAVDVEERHDELPYRVDEQRLLLGAFTADDDGADPIATWTLHEVVGGDDEDLTYELHADHTALVQASGAWNGTDIGGWSRSGEWILIALPHGEIALMLHGGALGVPYERL
jgi:hypothetical protein